MRFPAFLALTVLVALPLHADDGAASIAAGGLILMKREPRIAMAKEVLTISLSKVVVDYDFRNDSTDNITTEVAFPIPAFEFPSIGDNSSLKQLGFDDFQLWVNGQPAKFTIETRAFLDKKDVTAALAAMKIDIGTFGHYGNKAKTAGALNFYAADIEHLSAAQKSQLVQMKLISVPDSRADDWQALWRVEKKYHWTQDFPAHGTVHVRHQYTPVVGASNMIGDMSKYNAKSGEYSELASLCPTPAMAQSLGKTDTQTDPTGLNFVDFILTTANTWKTPIEDFTLNIERLAGDYPVNDVSLCWDGPVTKVDSNHFSAHVSGLVPAKELRVGFIHSDWTRAVVKENQQYEKDHGLKK
jgi:hypothetical protein